MSVEQNEEELKNPKFMVFTLLRILKFFYSFKQLELKLGIPSQVLWRYITLRVTPEKQTAEKILAKIKESKLIEEVISSELSSEKELWVIASNPGILELSAIRLLYDIKKTRIDAVLPTPDALSTPLATIISSYLKTRLCIPSKASYSKYIIVEPYEVASGLVDAISIPRDCIPRKSRILVTTLFGSNLALFKPVFRLAMKRDAQIASIFSVIGNQITINEAINRYGIQPLPKVIVLVEKDLVGKQL